MLIFLFSLFPDTFFLPQLSLSLYSVGTISMAAEFDAIP